MPKGVLIFNTWLKKSLQIFIFYKNLYILYAQSYCIFNIPLIKKKSSESLFVCQFLSLRSAAKIYICGLYVFEVLSVCGESAFDQMDWRCAGDIALSRIIFTIYLLIRNGRVLKKIGFSSLPPSFSFIFSFLFPSFVICFSL